MKHWLVIPARAGSSMKDKNLREIGGKPLWRWVYDCAEAYQVRQREHTEIVVTSDIPALIEYAIAQGDMAECRTDKLPGTTILTTAVPVEPCEQ